jgi:hypothetical protein
MFYVRTTTYRARTGPVDTRMMYPCGHCGLQSTALVRTEGNATSVAVYGAGGSADIARRKAFEAAHTTALQTLKTTACPSCRQLQPFVLAEFAEAQRRVTWRRKIGLPVAIGAAVTAGLLLGIPGILDVRHSAGLLVAALGLSLAVGGVGIGAALQRWRSPLRALGAVWFWWAPPPGYRDSATAAQWTAAPQPASVPQVTQPPAHALVAGLLAAGVGFLTMIMGLGAWAASFSSVYVVNPTPDVAMVVRVDGKEVGRVARFGQTASSKDVVYERFEVRAGERHHLEIVNPAGAHSYDLAGAGGAHGWVVAPGSLAAGLCLLGTEAVYGLGEPADPELLNAKGDIAELPRTYDELFEAPPSSMSTSESTVRRWTLRGMSCGSLEDGSPLAFQARARGKAPAAR